jgi:hypothetical protein
MRKYRYLALATGAALLVSVPAGAALATNVQKTKPVLTIGKVKGTAVKKGAILKAGLPKKGKVTFAISGNSLTCTSSSIKAKVVKNPAKAGEATLSVTAVSVSKCGKVPILNAPLSLKSINLPYNATIKAAKGDPVKLSETKKSKPMGFKATVGTGASAFSCVFTAASMSGHAANKHNTVSFTKQTLTLDKAASSSTCVSFGISKATVTATYGPIVDSSVKHSPKVFVS